MTSNADLVPTLRSYKLPEDATRRFQHTLNVLGKCPLWLCDHIVVILRRMVETYGAICCGSQDGPYTGEEATFIFDANYLAEVLANDDDGFARSHLGLQPNKSGCLQSVGYCLHRLSDQEPYGLPPLQYAAFLDNLRILRDVSIKRHVRAGRFDSEDARSALVAALRLAIIVAGRCTKKAKAK